MRLTRRAILNRRSAFCCAAAARRRGAVFPLSLRSRLGARLEARPVALWRAEIPEGFKHFDYVNPNAPKGGAVRHDGDSAPSDTSTRWSRREGSVAAGLELITDNLSDGVG